MIDVPAEVRGKAAAEGAGGERWLRDLDDVVRQLERDWGVVAGATLRGGSDAYVAEATTRDGARAVLKLALPGAWASHQIETLALAAGRGYVRLLEHDDERQAMLLERLGPSLASLGLPVRTQVEHICVTLRRAWSVPPDRGFQSGAEKARALADFIATAWRGLASPPACDLAVPMREWGGDLHERCSTLSRLTGVDPRAIWEWGFVERVSTGLLALQVGREQLGCELLAVAERPDGLSRA